MNGARRDLLKFAGGAAVGAALSPAPWRLLGDTAIWSQNWSWMPRVPRGEVSVKEVNCALCPAGCKLNARCVNELPYAMAPREHAICPAGVVGHHVALHPLRLRETLHRGVKSETGKALEAAHEAMAKGQAAVLDMQPGRVASELHHARMRKEGGRYLVPPRVEGATAWAVGERLGMPGAMRMHLASAKTVLSIGTPVLDGWAGPDVAARPEFHLVQADARQSATARRANDWLRIRPGGETALLMALLGVVEGDTADAARLAKRAGVDAGQVRTIAARLQDGPALIVADGEPFGAPAAKETLSLAAALQTRLGMGAYRQTEAMARADEWSEVPAGSIQLLLIDEPGPGLAIPWNMVAPKLAADATVVALTWNRQSFARQAAWQAPVPVYLEGLHEAPSRHDAADAGLRLSEGWMEAPEGAMAAADFVAELCGETADYAERLKSAKPVEAGPVKARPGPPPGADERRAWMAAALHEAPGLTVVSYGWRQASVSPLLGKLWQESELRAAPNSSVRDESRQLVEICATPAYVRDRMGEVRS